MSSNAPKLVQTASWTLYAAAGSALLGAAGLGLVMGWTAPAFDSMRSNESVPQYLDSDEDKEIRSWIGSSVTLGALVGALVAGPVAQIFGRKKALIIVGLPFMVGWLLLSLSERSALLIAGRVVAGFSCGLLSGTVPTYMVEISIISNRGFLGASFQLFITIGILVDYVIGAFINWNYLAAFATIPTVLMTVFMFYMPETPSWLLAHNQPLEAEKALAVLRDPDSENEKEFAQLQEQAKSIELGQSFSFSSYGSRQHGCPLFIALALMFFQQFSGINAVMFYATSIFIESGSSLEPKYCTIVVGAAQVIATIVGSLLVDRLGRKLLLNVSGTLHTLSTAILGLYYYSIEGSTGANDYGWLPVTCLVIFIIGFSVGFGPISWLMVAEVTPQNSRSATCAIATSFCWACAFIVTKYFEALKSLIAKAGVFWFFAGCSLLSIVFVTIFLPETKGKSQEEIEAYFGRVQETGSKNRPSKKNA